jgi:threonine synthase
VVFAVPSGNLGNLTAGVLAARMGLPVSRFIAATNANDTLPEYLTTGRFRPRPSVATLSNAMDVGDPSNFARLDRLFHGSVDAMRAAILGAQVSEAETRAAIREAHARHGCVLDPHGAVAYAAARRYLASGGGGPEEAVIAMATAHPAKFAEAIREELGFEPPLPEADRGWRDWPLSAIDLPAPSPEALARLLFNLPPPRPV